MTLAFKTNTAGTGPTPQQLAQAVETLLAELQTDAANLTTLQQQLQQLLDEKNGKNPPHDIDQQIAAKEQEIAQAQDQQKDDRDQLNSDEEELDSFGQNATAFATISENFKKTAQKSAQKQFEEKALNDQQTEKQKADEARAEAFQSTAAYSTLEIDYGQDALQRLNNIKNDQESIDEDEAREKVLKDEIIEDSIKVGCSLGLDVSAAEDLVKSVAELIVTQDDEKARKADLSVQQAALKDDLTHLFSANEQSLTTEIQTLFKDVEKILTTVLSGKNSEANLQQVSSLLAEVMSIVQMIMTKVQQMRSQNDQWSSRANADSQEISANKSQVSYEQMATLEEFASFMKTVMNIVKYGGEAVAGLTAVLTGGATAIAMAALMIILTQAGVFDMATNALANKMDKNGAVWAKVLADATVALASVMVTHSVGAIGQEVASSLSNAASQAANSVSGLLPNIANQSVQNAVDEVEIELAEIGNKMGAQAGNDAGQVAKAAVQNEAAAAQNAGQQVKSQFQKLIDSLKNAVRSLGNSVNKQNVAMSTVYFGATNGVVDTADLIAAAATHQANASQEELEKQELFQILNIVVSLLQAVAEFVGTQYVAGDEEGVASRMNKLLENNLPMLLKVCQLMQSICSFEQAGAAASLLSTDVFKGKFLQDLGTADSNTSVYKALGEMNKLYEQKQIELFASKLQQMIEQVSIMVRKCAEAENQAALLLEQSAV